MDEVIQERQLQEYNLETSPLAERQANWQQERLDELQSNQPPIDDLQRYTAYQEEQLSTNELEQIINIDEVQHWSRLQQHYQKEEQLVQTEQWEQIAFLNQQLQQPTNYYP